MPIPHRRRVTAMIAAVFAISLSSIPGRAAEQGSLVVIFDGSGSIWGAIEGTRQPKLVLAREALRQALGKLAPQTRVGLAIFGHRRGDCTDADVIRPPEPLDVGRLMEPFERLNPRGRGPITLALREAAKWLPRDAGPRTLLLIHDDADNCQPDLCAAAAELGAAGVTAHVVGLAVKSEDMAKMACLPRSTGGRYFNAQNAEQVAAYIEEALLLSAAGASGLKTAAPAATAIVPPAPTPARGPPALYLRALLAPNTEPVGTPLFWTVTDETRPDAPVFGASAVNPTVPVPPGRYVVEVRDGPLSMLQKVELRDRPTAVTIMLNAGALRVRVRGRRTAGLLPEALITATDANGSLLLATRGGEAVAMLPAGRHLVRAAWGVVRSEQTVTVTAGRLSSLDIPLNAARLELSTARRDGAFELDSPIFSVLEDDPDAPDGRREVARSAAQPAEFVLPPGTYYAVARQGAVVVRDRVAIGPGDAVKHTLVTAAGSLALSTSPPAFSGGADTHISYRVTRLDNAHQEPVLTSQPSPTLLLPSGRYRVEGRYGLMNVRTIRDVDIKAGQAQQLVFEHEAAALRLRAAGGRHADVSWVIQDQAGNVVWTGAQPEALTKLQAGHYTIRADTRSKRIERKLELRSGESRVFELPVD